MPTLRALECFVAVVERGSLTAASTHLHLSQPALSHQLATLEKEIGTPLLERLPRGVRPTPTGRAVLADATAALASANRVMVTGRAVAAGSVGTLRIVCAETMTVPILAPTLRKWSRSHAGIRVELTEATSADTMADAIGSGDADIAIGPASEHFSGNVAQIGTEEIVAVIPAGLDLTDEPDVPWTALEGRPIVHYHPSNGLGAWIDSVAAQHNSSLAAATRTRNATTAAQLAHAGLGIALVPTTALPPRFTGVVTPLRPRLTRAVVAMIGSPTDALVQRFVSDVCSRGVPSLK
nr:LysR family transcriptional regulator [Rhodococcus sp. (in: high G+C Gram-positive bacteria)]